MDVDVKEMMKEASAIIGEVLEQPAPEAPPEQPAPAPAPDPAPAPEPAPAPAPEPSPAPAAIADIRAKADASKREREMRKKEKELADREAALGEMSKLRDLAKEDEFAAAEKLLGPDFYRRLTTKLLSGEKAKPDPAVQKVDELKAWMERKEAEAKKARDEEENRKIEDAYYSSIREATKAEEFEMINVFGDTARNEAVAFAKKHFDEYGSPLEPRDAARALEDFLSFVVEGGVKTKKGAEIAKKVLGVLEKKAADEVKTKSAKDMLTNKEAAQNAPPPVDADPSDDEAVINEAAAVLRAAIRGDR